jgi:hypothetical protein
MTTANIGASGRKIKDAPAKKRGEFSLLSGCICLHAWRL